LAAWRLTLQAFGNRIAGSTSADLPSRLDCSAVTGDSQSTPDLVELTTQLTDHFRRIFLDHLSAVKWSEVRTDRLAFAQKVCAVRQYEGLRSALVLAANGLGHLAVSFVRPAVDEHIWLAYLNTIDRQTAGRLLALLNVNDIARAVRAQQGFIGRDAMIAQGWPDVFLTGVASGPKAVKRGLRDVAAELGWPTSKRIVPSTDWIADKTDAADLYAFLYSATSRMLHFSAAEIFRRGWGDPLRSETVALHDTAYTTYRLDFALYWLIRLFNRTLSMLIETGTIQVDAIDYGGDDSDALLDLVRRHAELGIIPIVHPAEMNFIQGAPAFPDYSDL
jgi:hypothetical protein